MKSDQPIRNQTPSKAIPRLLMQMRCRAGSEKMVEAVRDSTAKNDDVGDEEELQRPDVGAPLSLQICQRENPWADEQAEKLRMSWLSMFG